MFLGIAAPYCGLRGKGPRGPYCPYATEALLMGEYVHRCGFADAAVGPADVCGFNAGAAADYGADSLFLFDSATRASSKSLAPPMVTLFGIAPTRRPPTIPQYYALRGGRGMTMSTSEAANSASTSSLSPSEMTDLLVLFFLVVVEHEDFLVWHLAWPPPTSEDNLSAQLMSVIALAKLSIPLFRRCRVSQDASRG